jgi:hypothetical protein
MGVAFFVGLGALILDSSQKGVLDTKANEHVIDVCVWSSSIVYSSLISSDCVLFRLATRCWIF